MMTLQKAVGDAQKRSNGKQASYFQVGTLALEGRDGGEETRTAPWYKYLMCYYFSINIKLIKTWNIDEVYF